MRCRAFFSGLTIVGIVIMQLSLLSQQSHGADIETLIMPGDVVESHSDLESECSNCHELRLPHRACPHCGFYKDREVIETAEE